MGKKIISGAKIRQYKLYALGLAVVIAIVGAGLGVRALVMADASSKNEQSQVTESFSAPKVEESSDEVEPIDTPPTSTGDSVKSSDTPVSNSTKPSKSKPAAPAPQPAPQPQNEPFRIAQIYMNEATHYCAGLGVLMQVSSVTVAANNTNGGSFTYQVEVTGAWETWTPYKTTRTIPAGQAYMTIAGYQDPGMFYAASNARDGQSMRVRIVSPNDLATRWYTIPAGANDACRNG